MTSLNTLLQSIDNSNNATIRKNFKELTFTSNGKTTKLVSGSPSSDIVFTLPDDTGSANTNVVVLINNHFASAGTTGLN